jgi:hypothetical protein
LRGGGLPLCDLKSEVRNDAGRSRVAPFCDGVGSGGAASAPNESMRLYVTNSQGDDIQFVCDANAQGFLGKITAELAAPQMFKMRRIKRMGSLLLF